MGCTLVHGAGDCSESNFCYGNGVCVNGLCDCYEGFISYDCSISLSCKYWDEETQEWSTEGVSPAPPPGGIPDGFMHCDATHLTDFGGIIFPTSAAELLKSLTPTFNTFTMEEAFAALADFDFMKYPLLTGTLFGMLGLDFLTLLLLGMWRQHRKRRARERDDRLTEEEVQLNQVRELRKEKLAASVDERPSAWRKTRLDVMEKGAPILVDKVMDSVSRNVVSKINSENVVRALRKTGMTTANLVKGRKAKEVLRASPSRLSAVRAFRSSLRKEGDSVQASAADWEAAPEDAAQALEAPATPSNALVVVPVTPSEPFGRRPIRTPDQQRQGARERLAAQEALVKRVKLYSTTLTPFDEHGKPLDPLEAKARLRNAAAGKVKKTIQDRILDPRTNRPEFWADKAEKRAQSLKEKETRKSGGSGSDEPLRLEYKPAELPAGATEKVLATLKLDKSAPEEAASSLGGSMAAFASPRPPARPPPSNRLQSSALLAARMRLRARTNMDLGGASSARSPDTLSNRIQERIALPSMRLGAGGDARTCANLLAMRSSAALFRDPASPPSPPASPPTHTNKSPKKPACAFAQVAPRPSLPPSARRVQEARRINTIRAETGGTTTKQPKPKPLATVVQAQKESRAVVVVNSASVVNTMLMPAATLPPASRPFSKESGRRNSHAQATAGAPAPTWVQQGSSSRRGSRPGSGLVPPGPLASARILPYGAAPPSADEIEDVVEGDGLAKLRALVPLEKDDAAAAPAPAEEEAKKKKKDDDDEGKGEEEDEDDGDILRMLKRQVSSLVAPPEFLSRKNLRESAASLRKRVSYKELKRQVVSLKDLRPPSKREIKKKVFDFKDAVIGGFRSDHTAVSFVAPAEDDEALSDMQVVQLFWFVLIFDLYLNCLQYGGYNPDSSAYSPIDPLNDFINSMIAAIFTVGAVMACRAVFRWGNQRKIKPKAHPVVRAFKKVKKAVVAVVMLPYHIKQKLEGKTSKKKKSSKTTSSADVAAAAGEKKARLNRFLSLQSMKPASQTSTNTATPPPSPPEEDEPPVTPQPKRTSFARRVIQSESGDSVARMSAASSADGAGVGVDNDQTAPALRGVSASLKATKWALVKAAAKDISTESKIDSARKSLKRESTSLASLASNLDTVHNLNRRASAVRSTAFSVVSGFTAATAIDPEIKATFEKFKLRTDREYYTRSAIAWIANFYLYGHMFFNVVVYAAIFGPDATVDLLSSWLKSLTFAMGVIEPLNIIAISAIPLLLKEDGCAIKCYNNCFYYINEMYG